MRFHPMMALTLTTLIGALALSVQAADWPMWRYDAARSNASPSDLSAELHLNWTLHLPKPRPAWPASQAKLQFDSNHQPIVIGDLLVLGSTVDDSITAYETKSGEQAWRFDTEGPVPFAPVGYHDRIYVASDDGYLYCLQASDGSLLWKVRGGPDDSRIIGNDRLVSTWPVRGGPVLIDGTIYFTERGKRIRKIAPDQTLSTVIDSGLIGARGIGGPTRPGRRRNLIGSTSSHRAHS